MRFNILSSSLMMLGLAASLAPVGSAAGGEVLFSVDDLFLGSYLPGHIISGGPLATNDSDNPDTVAWALVSLIGPDGAEVGATVDPLSGVFVWDSSPIDSFGLYTTTIQGTNGGGTPVGTDNGLLTFNLTDNLIPEPMSVTLLGMGMIGLGFMRRH